MIKALFLKTINMSITASVVILAVLAIRWMFRKQPKIYSYILWSIVLFRLLCPYSISLNTSLFNALPQANVNEGQLEYNIPQTLYQQPEEKDMNTLPENQTVNDTVIAEQLQENIIIENDTAAPESNVIINTEKQNIDYINILSVLWICGGMYLVLNNLLSLYEIKSLLKFSTHLNDNIYLNEIIPTAFITGILHPKIYLPDNLDSEQQKYILLHEQTHIRRKDYIFKLLSFIALCIHWFNPLVWLAYRLGESDMEMSCDEAVIRLLGNSEKRGYSQTLLSISIPKNNQFAMHLAFGEGETKNRIVNVLNFKKPAFKYIVAIIFTIGLAASGLMFNPAKLSAISAAEINKTDVAYSYFKQGNRYYEPQEKNYNSIISDLNKITLSESEEHSINTENGNSFAVFTEDEKMVTLNFNEDFTEFWILDSNTERDGLVYKINNSEYAAELYNNIFNDTTSPRELTQLVFPAFTNMNSWAYVDIEPVQVNVLLPEMRYVSKEAKNTDIYDNIYPYCMAIYDNSHRNIGIIAYKKPEDIFALDYNILSKEWNENGLLKSATRGANEIKYAESTDSRFVQIGCSNYVLDMQVIIFLEKEYVSEYDIKNIFDTIEITEPVIPVNEKIDYSEDMWVKGDESIDNVAKAAVMKILGNKYDETAVSDITIFETNSPINTHIVNFTFNDIPNCIYLNKVDDTNYKITYSRAGSSYISPLSESTVETVERVAEIPYGISYITDEAYNGNDSVIMQKGKNGLANQTVEIEYVNGIIVSEKIINNVILKEPVNETVKEPNISSTNTTNSGKLIWPTAAGRIARGFTGQYPSHNGVDIAAPTGTAIYAADTGIVTRLLYTNTGYGIHCIIEHNGYQTVYAHCSGLEVVMGQKVQQGQLIGYVGSTGNSTGPHLHFEVKNGDERYDPYSWF